MAIPEKVLRIADANFNRIGEGLRFLEEIARLALDDAVLTRELKNLRHELLKSTNLSQEMVSARDAARDVGAEIEEDRKRDLNGTVIANARRVQQSLRVMEELGKLPDFTEFDPEKFKRARFALYTIEKALLVGLKKLTGISSGEPKEKLKNVQP